MSNFRESIRLLCASVLALAAVGALAAGGDKKDRAVVAAVKITKLYAEDPAGFDKKYKGKTVVVEGVVALVTALDKFEKHRFVMLEGYRKGKESSTYRIRCRDVAEIDDLRIGHKVRIKGTCQ